MATVADLNVALSCPRTTTFPRYPRAAYRLLNECWATVLYRYLPDTHIVGLLEDVQITHGNMCITQDDCQVYNIPLSEVGEPHDPLDYGNLTKDEIDFAVKVLQGSRNDFAKIGEPAYRIRLRHDTVEGLIEDSSKNDLKKFKSLSEVWLDEEFDKISRWVWDLELVTGDEREKHWPPLHIKEKKDLIEFSKKKKLEGILNIGAVPHKLRSYALAALAEHIRRELDRLTDERFVKARADEFLAAWSTVSNNGTFRLGVTHQEIMGLFNGKDCFNVVYDYDPTAKTFHCFPVENFPNVRDSFTEAQLGMV